MIEPQLRSHIIALADAYKDATGLSINTISEKASRDHKFIARIKGGWSNRASGEPSTFTVRRYDEMMAWFRDNWPKDTPWPAGVPRPKVAA